MERRAASHTEEEEMNQRRKLLSAARRGDTKAISKLFELYQVRVLSGEQLAKVNRTSTYMAPVPPAKGAKREASGSSKGAKSAAKSSEAGPKPRGKSSVKTAPSKLAKARTDKKRTAPHK